MESGQPTQNRILSIDAIRGIALFGILIVNLLSFHSPHFLYGGKEDFYNHLGDSVVLASIDMFVQASFYPLFSMLFGIGIYMMYERLNERDFKPQPILVRRMIILASFGLIHGIFIWYGDILFTYGVIGLISLFFINKSTKSLKVWAFNLLMIASVVMTILLYQMREYLDFVNHERINQSYDGYQGGYRGVLFQNFSDWMYMNDLYQWFFMILTILPMFLIGMMIQKRGWIKNIDNYKTEINKWIVGSFSLFVLFKIVPYLFGMPKWFESAQDFIGGSSSSVFYLLVLLVIFQSRNFSFIERILSNVGKLSLTNYITQSLLGIFIFYGIGLNLYGKLNAISLVVVAIMIYIFQMLFSQWYVKRFQYGPLEWVYRSLTYGERQPMVKKGD